jgi:hypothetical protein
MQCPSSPEDLWDTSLEMKKIITNSCSSRMQVLRLEHSKFKSKLWLEAMEIQSAILSRDSIIYRNEDGYIYLIELFWMSTLYIFLIHINNFFTLAYILESNLTILVKLAQCLIEHYQCNLMKLQTYPCPFSCTSRTEKKFQTWYCNFNSPWAVTSLFTPRASCFAFYAPITE